MTRERLETLPDESLMEIARKEGVSPNPSQGRAAIIEAILEALEEDRTDRINANNTAIDVEEKKYTLVAEDDLPTDGHAEFPLPQRYNETEIRFLLRDPAWAFAYWDIAEKKSKDIHAEQGFEGLFLRVHLIEGDTFTGKNSVEFFDIPVQFTDDKWYINLPEQGASYCIELAYRVKGEKKSVAVSNVIKSPRGTISDEPGKDTPVTDRLLAQLGASSYGGSSEAFAASSDGIPQRIMSLHEGGL